MHINHITEVDGETVKFQGKLEGPELAFVVEVGINHLLQQGALPFVSKKSHNGASIMMSPNSTEQ